MTSPSVLDKTYRIIITFETGCDTIQPPSKGFFLLKT